MSTLDLIVLAIVVIAFAVALVARWQLRRIERRPGYITDQPKKGTKS